MKIPDSGCDERTLFRRLEGFRGKDTDWRSGKMFGHAFLIDDKVRDVIERAYTMYLWENALDPTLFPSLLEMENEVLSMSAGHLRGDDEVAGNFTSGGTESILLPVFAAREKAKIEKPEITAPEMIVPVTAHAAFHKAASYFGIRVVSVPVDPLTFKAEVSAIQEAISPNTILIAASAPSYAHGVVDPIPEIGKLAEEHGLLLHVDACMGGFLLPFYRELGAEVCDFDFSVPGVTSISMDFHKYAFAAKGASVVLYRNRELRKHQIFACSNWTGYTLLNPTVQSSRSGGALAATWAVLNLLGREGYLEVTRSLKEATERIIREVGAMDDIHILGKPEMCIFGVGSETVNVFHIVDEMKTRGWHIQAQLGLGEAHRENFHLTVLPSNIPWIDPWLKDLGECVKIAKERGSSDLVQQIVESLSGSENIEVSEEEMKMFFAMLGISGDAMPERMAEINEILNALPPSLADQVLISYFNDLNTQQS